MPDQYQRNKFFPHIYFIAMKPRFYNVRSRSLVEQSIFPSSQKECQSGEFPGHLSMLIHSSLITVFIFLKYGREQGHAGKFHHFEKFFSIAGTILRIILSFYFLIHHSFDGNKASRPCRGKTYFLVLLSAKDVQFLGGQLGSSIQQFFCTFGQINGFHRRTLPFSNHHWSSSCIFSPIAIEFT